MTQKFTPREILKCIQGDTGKDVHCSTVCNTGKLEITRMHINQKMDK